MADNVAAKSDASATVATLGADDIGGIHYVRNKIIIGADGTNDGDVSATNPMPIKGTGTAGTANAGVVTVQGVASMTPVQVGDNSSSLTVDNGGTFAVQVDGTALTRLTDIETNTDSNAVVGNGAAATAQRVTLANDSTGIVALTTSTASIGKLAANSGVDIGDVDVTSIAAGDNNIGNVDIVTVPTDPFGANADAASATGSISAKLRFIASTGIPVTGTVTVGSHAVTNAGTFATQIDGAALTALQKIDDPVLVDDAAYTPATSSVMMAGFEADESSTDSVDEGDAGAARMTLDRKIITNPQPHTQGGLSIFRSLDIDETEEDVKTSAGQVYGWYIFNAATSIRYVKFYNATAANVTVGSTTPVMTIPVPATTSGGIGFISNSALGIAFDTAISVAATTGLADNDTGAPAANDVIIQVFYK